jgi:hypothetical protein
MFAGGQVKQSSHLLPKSRGHAERIRHGSGVINARCQAEKIHRLSSSRRPAPIGAQNCFSIRPHFRDQRFGTIFVAQQPCRRNWET